MTEPLPPHPPLERYYARDADRARAVNELFDAGAASYEWVCKVMSLGTGEKYRGQTLTDAGLVSGARILDIATGTGLVLRSARAIVGPTGLALGLDPSRGMLTECRKRCDAPLFQARGESLPFRDGSFDMISMGYGLRHVADLTQLFRECHRVLRPGGRLLILEMTQPQSAWGRWLNRFYLGVAVPRAATLSVGRADAKRMMEYFWHTIEQCVPPESILRAMRDSGFADAKRKVTGGILSEYLAAR
ncbi:MAG: class I SAM-dependent methyltransferase [Acidobacteria bacterium]|nr:class I SAM-dependent methyltransferase [Acidobacteriota bacterium]